MIDQIKNITIVGLGTLGAQIALQSAVKGYKVTGCDPVPGTLQRYLDEIPKVSNSENGTPLFDTTQWFNVLDQIIVVPDLKSAVENSDLIIESVPENLDTKLKVWKDIDAFAPSDTILATNSSSMPVSKLEGATRRPQKCLNMHFYQMVFGQIMADLMGGTQTDPEVLERGRKFIQSLDVVPLQVNKESLGFCFNRIWRAVKREALHMWAEQYVDFRDIDRGWMVFNSSSWGPFSLMDSVGLDVIWDIEMIYYKESGDPKDHPPKALKDKIDAGELGVKTGKGFYTYPDPEFSAKNFLTGPKL